MPLKTVTPAHNRGAIFAGARSLGTERTLSVRRVQYSASRESNQHDSFFVGGSTSVITASLLAQTINGAIGAHLEVADLALMARIVMATMPPPADTVAHLPSVFARTNSNNISDHLQCYNQAKVSTIEIVAYAPRVLECEGFSGQRTIIVSFGRTHKTSPKAPVPIKASE